MPSAPYHPPLPLNTPWSQHIVTLNVLLPCIAAVFVFLRFYSRKLKGLKIGIDDWLVLFALFVHILHSVTGVLACVAGGVGHHKADLAPIVLTNNGKILVATQVPFAVGLGLTKCSACFLLRRVFDVHRKFQIFVWVLLALSIAWSIMTFLTVFLDCHPLAFNWDKTIPDGHCDSLTGAFLGVAVLDIFVDLSILISPVPILWNLQMALHLKAGLTLTFGLGYFTVGIAISRIATDLQVDLEGDYTWTIASFFFWSYMEVGIAIIVACLVVLKPVVDRFTPSSVLTKGSISRRNRSSKTYANLESDGVPLEAIHAKGTASAMADGLDRSTMTSTSLSDRNDRINVRRDITVEEDKYGAA